MHKINIIYFSKFLMEFNFYFLFFIFIISSIILYLSKYSMLSKLNQNSLFNILKWFNITTILISFFIHIVTSLVYCTEINKYTLSVFSELNLYNIHTISYYSNFFLSLPIKFNIDFFGLIILTLAYIVGFISLLALDTRLYWKNIKYIFSFNIFLLIVYLYVTVSNILLFFMCYEMLLIPSFLIVYFVSPSRRAIQASLYFVIWTQLGSLLVLIAICYMINISNTYEFSDLKYFNFTGAESTIISFLLFLGFGFKAPIWPFHYW